MFNTPRAVDPVPPYGVGLTVVAIHLIDDEVHEIRTQRRREDRGGGDRGPTRGGGGHPCTPLGGTRWHIIAGLETPSTRPTRSSGDNDFMFNGLRTHCSYPFLKLFYPFRKFFSTFLHISEILLYIS